MNAETAFLLKGLLLGLSIAAPVGPIGVLCIRRTIAYGFFAGLAGGLGTALADAFYAGLAAFGFSAVFGDLVAGNVWFGILGAAFLLWLGWKTWTAGPAEREAKVSARTLAGTFAATFALTLANPATIATFAALFLAMGLGDTGGSHEAAAALVAGVFAGSLLWWIVLSTAVVAVREKLDARAMVFINRAAGALLAGFGLWIIAGVV
ncbi:MAG: LysE family transporter [Rhodospirillales bacterium]|nr:LysE family transporter [Rhodospirillales bacterium]